MNITIDSAQAILMEMGDWTEIADSIEIRDRLRASLLFLKSHSDYQIFGICAENLALGWQALNAYAIAFGYEFPRDAFESYFAKFASISEDGGVYLKFNPKKLLEQDTSQLVHIDSYMGKYRGVLVSYHSSFGEDYNGTHGHFPLDLFMI
jgi:hypothetical protein